MDPDTLTRCGQSHLLEGLDDLPTTARAAYLAELGKVDIAYACRALADSLEAEGREAEPVTPPSGVLTLDQGGEVDLEPAKAFVRGGHLAILLLAGGQGTRLGSSLPKGMYDIGLPNGKSLFELHADRVRLAERTAGAEPGSVKWAVVTSAATDAATRAFFTDQRFFGLLPSQVFFAVQGSMPAFEQATGHVVRSAPGILALSPDGNGGVYRALASPEAEWAGGDEVAAGAVRAPGAPRASLLRRLEDLGATHFDACSVDNALENTGDLAWIARCLAARSDCASRVLPKAYPEEAVGVFAAARRPDSGASPPAHPLAGLRVVEYSELDPDLANAVDPATGRLCFNWSNICRHWFSAGFVERAAELVATTPLFHLARKTLAVVAPAARGGGELERVSLAGIKLETFIFDAFRIAEKPLLVEGTRELEFAPVKNAQGRDSPATARALVLARAEPPAASPAEAPPSSELPPPPPGLQACHPAPPPSGATPPHPPRAAPARA